MNMDFAIQLAKIEATKYADKYLGVPKGSDVWSERYNGYFAGYMANVAERESLRAILKRYEKKNDAPIVTSMTLNLDDLV